MKEQLIKRLKSLAWRTGVMTAVVLVQFFQENVTQFHLAPELTVIIGLVLGEVTKFLNARS